MILDSPQKRPIINVQDVEASLEKRPRTTPPVVVPMRSARVPETPPPPAKAKAYCDKSVLELIAEAADMDEVNALSQWAREAQKREQDEERLLNSTAAVAPEVPAQHSKIHGEVRTPYPSPSPVRERMATLHRKEA